MLPTSRWFPICVFSLQISLPLCALVSLTSPIALAGPQSATNPSVRKQSSPARAPAPAAAGQPTDADGIRVLVTLYLRKEDVKALAEARRLSTLGNAFAQTLAAAMLARGEGASKNQADAARYERMAADQGDIEGMRALANWLKYGAERKDEAAATKWEAAVTAKKASPPKVQADYRAALSLIRPAAEQGNLRAIQMMTRLCSSGQGTPQNEAEALRWTQRGADLGDRDSMYALSIEYRNGSKATTKNEEMGMSWLRKAADAGHAQAQMELAESYGEGKGVALDYTQAEAWYLKAIKDPTLGNSARFSLARLYSKIADEYKKGEVVAQDIPESIKWYRKASDLGDAFATRDLAEIFSGGSLISADYGEAEKLYVKYAEQLRAEGRESPFSAGLLADVLESGVLGIPSDPVRAARLRISAAERGEELQWSFAASLYEHSDSNRGRPSEGAVSRNLVRSYVYYSISSERFKTDQDAVEGRDRVRKLLTPAELKEADSLLSKWRAAGSAKLPWVDVGLAELEGKIKTYDRSEQLSSPDQLVYVTNCDEHKVSSYRVYSKSGELMGIKGSPFPAGSNPNAIAVAPSGRFVYVVNSKSDNISGYAVDITAGTLKAIAGSPFPSGSSPSAVVVEPSGNFVYVLNESDTDPHNLTGYRVASETGTLTALPGSPYRADGADWAIAVDPSGNFLYAAQDLLGYRIDKSTGTLTPLPGSPFSPGSSPRALVVAPNGKFLYTIGGRDIVTGYKIDATSGELSVLPDSPTELDFNPRSLAIDPKGRFVYVTEMGGSKIAAFQVNEASGELTAIAGSPLKISEYTGILAFDPLGKIAYSGSVDGVATYRLSPTTGTLTPVPNFSGRGVSIGGNICSLAVAPMRRPQ
jgi:6-phosphogluconolactonase